MKRVLVNGAGGCISNHLVRRLKDEGFRVSGADLKHPNCLFDEKTGSAPGKPMVDGLQKTCPSVGEQGIDQPGVEQLVLAQKGSVPVAIAVAS